MSTDSMCNVSLLMSFVSFGVWHVKDSIPCVNTSEAACQVT